MGKNGRCAVLLSIILLTACSAKETTNNTQSITSASTSEVTSASSEQTATESTTIMTTEATTTTTTDPDDGLLHMSIDEISSLLRETYGNGMKEYTDGKTYTNKKSRKYGIIKVVNGGLSGGWTNKKNSWLVTYMIFEMDLNSEQYRSLEVGKEIKMYNKKGYDETRAVVAINRQYVLAVDEIYFKKKEQIFNEKPPYHYEGLNAIVDVFNGLKN